MQIHHARRIRQMVPSFKNPLKSQEKYPGRSKRDHHWHGRLEESRFQKQTQVGTGYVRNRGGII